MVDSPERGWFNVFAFVVASVVGGFLTGLALAVLGALIPWSPPPGVAVAGVAVLFCVALARDQRLIRIWMPENSRQVRQTVLRLRPVVGDLMFGFELGTGVRTFVPASVPYVVAVTVIMMAEAIPAMMVGAAFGLGRGLVVVDRVLHRDRNQWDQTMRRMERWWPHVGLVTAAVLLLALSITDPNL